VRAHPIALQALVIRRRSRWENARKMESEQAASRSNLNVVAQSDRSSNSFVIGGLFDGSPRQVKDAVMRAMQDCVQYSGDNSNTRIGFVR